MQKRRYGVSGESWSNFAMSRGQLHTSFLFYRTICNIRHLRGPFAHCRCRQETLSFFKTRRRRIYYICYCQSSSTRDHLDTRRLFTYRKHVQQPFSSISFVLQPLHPPFHSLLLPSLLRSPQVAKHISPPSKLPPQVKPTPPPPLHHIPPTSVRLLLHPPYPYLPHQRASHIKGHGPCIPYLRAKRED